MFLSNDRLAESEAAVCCDPDFTLNKEMWDIYVPSDPCVMDKFEGGLGILKSEKKKLRTVVMNGSGNDC